MRPCGQCAQVEKTQRTFVVRDDFRIGLQWPVGRCQSERGKERSFILLLLAVFPKPDQFVDKVA